MAKHHELTNVSISAQPDTDIWRKPPAHDVFTVAPTYLDIPPFTPNQIERALITFTGDWKQQFDQAGVVLYITSDDEPGAKPSWVKTGVEFFEGTPYISFVGCDRWADWSITPQRSTRKAADGSTSIELTVQGGTTLWAYEVSLDDKGEVVERFPIRECTWLLHEEKKKKVKIGAYCCRPAKDDVSKGELLQAHVSRLSLDLRES